MHKQESGLSQRTSTTNYMYLDPPYHDIRVSLHPPGDLTGQVTRIEPYCFAQGGSADIWKGRWTNNDSESIEVAVKVFKASEFIGKRTRLPREIKVWSAVHHANITPFLGITVDFDRPCMPCLVSPYYRNGDIISYLKKLPAIDKLESLTQVASGLSYLHGLSIIHGNIKGSNILIDDHGEAKITDFGFSRILNANGFGTQTAAGPSGGYPRVGHDQYVVVEGEGLNPVTTDGWRWKAPELMVAGPNETSTPLVSEAVDVYAFGMTVIEILTGSMPFSHIKSDANVILSVVAGRRPKREHCLSINDEIWVMLERCWDAEPHLRPSMAAVFKFIGLRATCAVVPRARL